MTLSDEVIGEIRVALEKAFDKGSPVFHLFEHISETRKRCACSSLPSPKENIPKLVAAAGCFLELDVPVKATSDGHWKEDWRKGEKERLMELYSAHAPFVKDKEGRHCCAVMGCDENGHVAASFDLQGKQKGA